MRELKYLVACTVDGFIAAEDGSAGAFIEDPDYFADLFEMFPETCPGHLREALQVRGENKHFDVVLMGRNTYEVGSKVGISSPYPTLKQYVFSTTMDENPDENVELVSKDAAEFVRGLKEETGKDIWLCGGSKLAATLLGEGLIDEVILKSNPVLLGAGIPLFSGTFNPVDLKPTSRKTYENGIQMLHYRVRG